MHQTADLTPMPYAKSHLPSHLPPELILHILHHLWNTPLSLEERTRVFKTNCTVSRTWLCLFVRIAMCDVYLPRPLSAEGFLRLLPERTLPEGVADAFTNEASALAGKICRSITFTVDGQANLIPSADTPLALRMYSEKDPALQAISTVMYMVTTFDYLPNLRHISIEYIDWSYDDIFEQLRVPVFPPQVTHLSIDYTYSPGARLPLATYLKSTYIRRGAPRVTIPNVRHLSLSGASSEFIADMLQVCPNVETLDITEPTRLRHLAPLPPTVRTLVLRHPGKRMDKEQMYWWTLDSALEAGLLRPSTKAQIVLRSGTPDPTAFTEMKRYCKRFGAEFVYERDEACSS